MNGTARVLHVMPVRHDVQRAAAAIFNATDTTEDRPQALVVLGRNDLPSGRQRGGTNGVKTIPRPFGRRCCLSPRSAATAQDVAKFDNLPWEWILPNPRLNLPRNRGRETAVISMWVGKCWDCRPSADEPGCVPATIVLREWHGAALMPRCGRSSHPVSRGH